MHTSRSPPFLRTRYGEHEAGLASHDKEGRNACNIVKAPLLFSSSCRVQPGVRQSRPAVDRVGDAHDLLAYEREATYLVLGSTWHNRVKKNISRFLLLLSESVVMDKVDGSWLQKRRTPRPGRSVVTVGHGGQRDALRDDADVESPLQRQTSRRQVQGGLENGSQAAKSSHQEVDGQEVSQSLNHFEFLFFQTNDNNNTNNSLDGDPLGGEFTLTRTFTGTRRGSQTVATEGREKTRPGDRTLRLLPQPRARPPIGPLPSLRIGRILQNTNKRDQRPYLRLPVHSPGPTLFGSWRRAGAPSG